MTNPPPVAPVEGHYALLRNGEIRGPLKRCSWPTGDYFICPADNVSWELDGTNDNASDYDIIATISPTDMQAVASGELERLRAALHKAEIEREYWRGCAVLAKDHVGELQKQLQDWINEGEIMQGKNNAGT